MGLAGSFGHLGLPGHPLCSRAALPAKPPSMEGNEHRGTAGLRLHRKSTAEWEKQGTALVCVFTAGEQQIPEGMTKSRGINDRTALCFQLIKAFLQDSEGNLLSLKKWRNFHLIYPWLFSCQERTSGNPAPGFGAAAMP